MGRVQRRVRVCADRVQSRGSYGEGRVSGVRAYQTILKYTTLWKVPTQCGRPGRIQSGTRLTARLVARATGGDEATRRRAARARASAASSTGSAGLHWTSSQEAHAPRSGSTYCEVAKGEGGRWLQTWRWGVAGRGSTVQRGAARRLQDAAPASQGTVCSRPQTGLDPRGTPLCRRRNPSCRGGARWGTW